MRAICAFIGEDFEPDMLKVTTYSSSAPIESQGIFTSSVGRWRSGLTPTEVAVAQLICSRQMKAFGYSVEPVQVDSLAIAACFAGTPYATYRALAANAQTRGPLLPYLANRIRNLVRF